MSSAKTACIFIPQVLKIRKHSKHLNFIAFRHNTFCNMQYITFHYNQSRTTLWNRKNASSGKTIAPQALRKQHTQPHRNYANTYTQPHRHCTNMYTQPHRHCANSIFSPTGIMRTVYSAPQVLYKEYIKPHRHYAKSIFSPTGMMQTVYSAPQALNIMLYPTGKTASHTLQVLYIYIILLYIYIILSAPYQK